MRSNAIVIIIIIAAIELLCRVISNQEVARTTIFHHVNNFFFTLFNIFSADFAQVTARRFYCPSIHARRIGVFCAALRLACLYASTSSVVSVSSDCNNTTLIIIILISFFFCIPFHSVSIVRLAKIDCGCVPLVERQTRL